VVDYVLELRGPGENGGLPVLHFGNEGELMKSFSTAQLSPPIVGHPGVRFLSFRGPALGRRGDVTLWISADRHKGKPLPMLLLLHGVFDSHWGWWMRGAVVESAIAMVQRGELPPIAIAMPSDGLWGDGSAYVRHGNEDAETWIVKDVVQSVKHFFPSVETGKFFLSGSSMGGFAALRLGCKYADRVAGISAHSSITRIEQMPWFVPHSKSDYVTGRGEKLDILYWAAQNSKMLPPIRFDCGRKDTLFQANRKLHHELTKLGIAHTFEEFQGGHEWSYWRRHVRDTLRFVNRVAAT
jgi:putative tributyrin esterase